MYIPPTATLPEDTVVFESRITIADLLEMINRSTPEGLVVTFITKEVADAIEADISKAVLVAIEDIVDSYIS